VDTAPLDKYLIRAAEAGIVRTFFFGRVSLRLLRLPGVRAIAQVAPDVSLLWLVNAFHDSGRVSKINPPGVEEIRLCRQSNWLGHDPLSARFARRRGAFYCRLG